MTLKGQCHEIFISVFPQFLSFWTPYSYAKVFLYMISILGRYLHMQKPRSVIDTAESNMIYAIFQTFFPFCSFTKWSTLFFFMIKTQLDPWYEEAYRFWRYFSTVFIGDEKNHAESLTPRSFLWHRSNRAVLCHDLYDSMLSIGNDDTAGSKIPIRISPRNRSNIRKPVRKSFRCPDGFVQRNKFGGNMTVDQ